MATENIRSFRFNPMEFPVDKRFMVLDFDASYREELMNEFSTYRETFYCFLLIEKGESEMTVNGYTSRLIAPCLVTSIPGDVWEWHETDAEGKFICFEAPFLQSVLRGGFTLEPISFLNSENHYPYIHLSDSRFNKLQTLTKDMQECLSEKPVFYDLIRSILWQFVFLAEKEYICNGNKGRVSEVKNHVVDFINLVNKYFTTNRDSWFYADKLNISPNYLNKISREKLGTSARDYIISRIMTEAKFLLRITNINVNEVAYKLGFEDTNYFIRLFKKNVGVTPKEYQKEGTL